MKAIVLARARALLPSAWVPASCHVWRAPLPCTPSGKVDRRALQAAETPSRETQAGPGSAAHAEHPVPAEPTLHPEARAAGSGFEDTDVTAADAPPSSTTAATTLATGHHGQSLNDEEPSMMDTIMLQSTLIAQRAATLKSTTADTPVGTVRAAVATIWRDLLHTDEQSSFTALGGDSLLAMRAVTRLKATLASVAESDAPSAPSAQSEEARALGLLAGAFAPDRLLQSPSRDAYAAQLAKALRLPFNPEEAHWAETALAAYQAAEDDNGDNSHAGKPEDRLARDVNQQLSHTAEPNTAVVVAAGADWVLAMETLLAVGQSATGPALADVNGGWTRSRPRFTPLHAAARNGALRALKVRERVRWRYGSYISHWKDGYCGRGRKGCGLLATCL